MISGLAARINDLLRHTGMRVVRLPVPSDRRRQRLLEINHISAIVDVGANSGQYGKLLRECGYRGSIYSYEPLPDAFRKLEANTKADPKWIAVEKAVSNSTAAVTVNIAANSYSSSILPMAKRHLDAAPGSKIVSSVEVPSTTLDEIIGEIPEQPLMLKIDAQGYEDTVLAGCTRMMRRIRLLEIELSLFEIYHGQALWRDMDARLVASGFELVSLAEGFFDGSTGELLQVDAIYRQNVI